MFRIRTKRQLVLSHLVSICAEDHAAGLIYRILRRNVQDLLPGEVF